MRLYLDTEFNGFGGELISMAIVDEVGKIFYRVLPLPEVVDPCVQEHVVPILDLDPIPYDQFRADLIEYLTNYYNPEIVVDWPSDVQLLFKVLLGKDHTDTFFFPCTVSVMSLKSISAAPHNALYDAIGLGVAYMVSNDPEEAALIAAAFAPKEPEA